MTLKSLLKDAVAQAALVASIAATEGVAVAAAQTNNHDEPTAAMQSHEDPKQPNSKNQDWYQRHEEVAGWIAEQAGPSAQKFSETIVHDPKAGDQYLHAHNGGAYVEYWVDDKHDPRTDSRAKTLLDKFKITPGEIESAMEVGAAVGITLGAGYALLRKRQSGFDL